MKNITSKPIEIEEDDMRPEYDFANMSGGVRGKYADAYRQGHTVTIHNEDGSTTVQHFPPEDGAILLAPDVREYFPDSESVNAALRLLITLIPKHCKTKHSRRKRTVQAVHS
jgi:hypothetical protein